LKLFLKSLAAAALAGAAGAVGQYSTGGTFNPKEMGKVALIGAIIGVVAYLKQSPVKP
jgi:hypothetical protein